MERIDRTLKHLVDQSTARANAAEGCAELRRRRVEQNDVDAYLAALAPAPALERQEARGQVS